MASFVELYLLAGPSNFPALPTHLGSYMRALLVSQHGRHLFVTPCLGLATNVRMYCIVRAIKQMPFHILHISQFKWRQIRPSGFSATVFCACNFCVLLSKFSIFLCIIFYCLVEYLTPRVFNFQLAHQALSFRDSNFMSSSSGERALYLKD